MNENETTKNLSLLLKIAACAVFDIALILAFFNIFSLFILIAPLRSSIFLCILLVTLFILNAAIITSGFLFRKYGAIAIALIFLAVFYSLIAIIIAIMTFSGSLVFYLVLQLILLALLLISLSAVIFFAGHVSSDKISAQREQTSSQYITLQLMQIENLLLSSTGDAREEALELFKKLEELINASTPFGRIAGNSVVSQVETVITRNLSSIQSGIKNEINQENKMEIMKEMNDTQNLVINREKLIVR